VKKDPLLVIVGPTATAKTSFAIRLAERLQGEIISADSVQVYRDFNIGSGKPDAEELSRAPHHLLDIRDALEPLEAMAWAELARSKIEEIRERGAVPIVCGGTFLWIRALLYGLADAPAGDEGIRSRHREIAEDKGRAFLHEELAKVDEKSAARLHPNDLLRVSRALEVFELSGRTLSAIQEEHGFRDCRYDARLIALEWERPVYEDRLRARIVMMLRSGWKQEVEALLQSGYGSARAMDAVGYRQVRQAVEAEAQGVKVEEETLAEDVTRVTRIFARRQRTWLRDEKIELKPSSILDDELELDAFARTLSLPSP